MIPDLEWLPALTGAAQISLRSNGRAAMATLAAAGIGIACLPCFVGDRTPGLRRLRPPTAAPERALWLGMHRDTRNVPRIRATAAFLSVAWLGSRRRSRPLFDRRAIDGFEIVVSDQYGSSRRPAIAARSVLSMR
jgi:DNA-binding transcriptional LysR family regulator